MSRVFRMGFVVNPLAGVGGPAAFKGSDADFIQHQARSGTLPLRAGARAQSFLEALFDKIDESDLCVITVAGAMGAAYFCRTDVEPVCVDCDIPTNTTSSDTCRAVQAIMAASVDLLVFVGGDGTARDVCSIAQLHVPVLGVPAGVKMHSAVFAIHPVAAAHVVAILVQGELVHLCERDVRDIDEEAFREGVVRSRFYGAMQVPELMGYVQQVKQGGKIVDELVYLDIAEDIKERIEEGEDNQLIIFSSGSTTQFIQKHLGYSATLLGVDVVCNHQVIALDVNAEALANLVTRHEGSVKIVTTAIGGQGHIFGRGNQQFTPEVLRCVARSNIWVVATQEKLSELDSRPLLVDTGDGELDNAFSGLISVVTGYRQQVLYRVGLL